MYDSAILTHRTTKGKVTSARLSLTSAVKSSKARPVPNRMLKPIAKHRNHHSNQIVQ